MFLKRQREKEMERKTNYGNWVPEKMLYLLVGGTVVFLAAAVVLKAVAGWTVAAGVCGVLGGIMLLYWAYMYRCHELFAFGKGNMMAKVHENLVQHLDWNGEGKLLDIGCGASGF